MDEEKYLARAVVKAFFRRELSAWEELNATIREDPTAGTRITRELIDAASDDSDLCLVGVAILDPLIAHHGDLVLESIIDAARADERMRLALRCVSWSGLPAGFAVQIVPLIGIDRMSGRDDS